MGRLLQKFYKQCSFLPLGLGKAGETFASGQYQWASGEELLMQVRCLSNKNQKPAPLELQALYFQTVVCIPLQNGAGVLEVGTHELVPESDGMLSQILNWIDGLVCQGTSRGCQIISSPFEASTEVLLNEVGNPYGETNEQYKSASMREIYGSRAILWQPSISSCYWSPSSTTSSSTPSANDQRENISNTTFLLNTPNNEDKLMSPASCSQATATSMVNSFDVLHILKHLDHIDMQDVQESDSYRLNDSEFRAPSHDHHLHLSVFPVIFPPTDVIASPLPSLMDDHRYAPPHSEGNTDNNYLFDNMLQPIQCAYSCVGNEQADGHYCLNQVAEGSPKEPNMECQISACDQLQVSSINCLPLLTCQPASHSASYTNDQQQQRRHMFSDANEREGMTDLFGQSERHTHAKVSAVLSQFPPIDYSLADNSQEDNLDHEIMPVQDADLTTEDEGSTNRNGRSIMRGSSTYSEGHQAFINDKMSCEQGEKSVVPSTVPSTTQAVGSYTSHASGSAELNKVVCSIPAQGSYVRYESSVADDYKVVGSSISQATGSCASYASGLAGVYKVIDSTTSQAGGSYVGYASGSAEAAKVVGTTISQAAGSYASYASGSGGVYKVGDSTISQAAGSYVSYVSGSAEAEKVVGSSISQAAGGYASYASGSAGAYKVVDSTTCQATSSYVSYVSGSAEVENLVGSSTKISSRQGASSLFGSGNRDDVQYRGQQDSGGFLSLQQLQGVQDDHNYNTSNCTNMGILHESNVYFANSASTMQNDAALHHMHAERNRRRKQGHCFDTLRTLVPNITKKYPKVAILERTIEHLKELKGRIGELEQENVALMNLKQKDQRELAKEFSKHVSKKKHATNVKSSTKDINSQESAICRCIDSASVEDRMPHFQLSLIKNVQDIKANATIMEILNSLQNKHLCCYEIDYDFLKNTNKLSINILANYKDEENHIPTLDEIQAIKEWWEHLIKN